MWYYLELQKNLHSSSMFLVYHFYTANIRSGTVFSESNENHNNQDKAQEEEN